MIQHEDGSLRTVSPEKAKEHIAAMTPERRALYETPHPESFDPKLYSGLKNHSQHAEDTARAEKIASIRKKSHSQ